MSEAIEIRFYHLEASSPLEEAPALIDKMYGTGLRSLIICPNDEFQATLNEALWAYDVTSFLPHGVADQSDLASEHPVLLATEQAETNSPKLLMSINNAPMEITDKTERAFYMFDGRDEAVKAKAREDYARYRRAGYDLTYWQKLPGQPWKKIQ